LNRRKNIKAGPSRLIPRKPTENLELSFVISIVFSQQIATDNTVKYLSIHTCPWTATYCMRSRQWHRELQRKCPVTINGSYIAQHEMTATMFGGRSANR